MFAETYEGEEVADDLGPSLEKVQVHGTVQSPHQGVPQSCISP